MPLALSGLALSGGTHLRAACGGGLLGNALWTPTDCGVPVLTALRTIFLPNLPARGSWGALLAGRVDTLLVCCSALWKRGGHPVVAPKPNVTDGCVGRLLPLTSGPASLGTWDHSGSQAGPPRLFLYVYSISRLRENAKDREIGRAHV